MRKILVVIVFLPFLFVHLFAQWQSKQTTALKIRDPIHVDGRLDEAVWDGGPEAGDFIQLQPEKGKPASERTTVKILYNDRSVYFGFWCYDSEPQKIAARMTKRDDDIRSDDSVYVLIDTFHDRRSCYYVTTNLLGTQWDGRITENGRTFDSTWDGIYKSAAERTEFGWTAEIAIELSGIKYEPGANTTWGLSLGRGIPRKLEFSFWTGPLESPYKVSLFGELKGLDLEKAEKKTQIIPHVISKVEEKRSTVVEAGLDTRYAFSQMVSGNLTINPDFATVEADQEEINLTRFELFLPEKRNFFLEGSEIYQQRIQLFYSKRISDIYGGAKVYGKSGGYEFQGLTAQTKKNEERGEDSANFTVFRLKRDVMKSSNIGFLAANKLVNGKNWGTTGIDTALYFTDTFSFTGQFAISYGDYNSDNIAFFLRPSYDSTTFHIHLRYTQLGRNFADNANKVGFIQDDNRRELDSAIEKTFFPRKWGLERLEYRSNYNIYWGLDGTLRSWKIDQEMSFDLKNKFSLTAEHHEEFKLFEKKFRNRQSEFELGYNTREWQSAAIAYSFGRNFDRDFHLVEGEVNYKLTEDLSISYELTRVAFDPDPENETTWIHVIRATNYFTNDLFIKLFYQINSTIDKENIQILFVYRFQPPFGSIQLAYQKGTGEFGEKGTQGHTLFLKIAYMF
ncbi:MAG: carbohydrate binding family 9 domain-containing protein [Candidatus Aminicenantes bacterium]|nr:carbohydrate binding family 9 domain-containing protein [Candidatus Aminicenantes bacterium]MDH5384270.1 carbohydrate binding family 9 domain-containing protein [Candidatus Aminicenantes bacterium]MDH5743676.1 carbohydrate binding family 9 domain-containing protein [Candidatus Aminicenantes bacterium]